MFPDILDCCIWCFIFYHLHVPFQLIHSVRHPVFIPVIFSERIIGNCSAFHTIPWEKSVWPVCDLQKIFPAIFPLWKVKITADILCNKMFVNIIQMFFHHERNLIFHHKFRHCPCIYIRPVQHSYICISNTFFLTFLYFFQHIFCLLHRVFYFLNMNCFICFLKRFDLFFKPDFIITDHS